jgi:hypothetical protein
MKEFFRRIGYVLVVAVPMSFTLLKVTWRQSKHSRLPTIKSVTKELENNRI